MDLAEVGSSNCLENNGDFERLIVRCDQDPPHMDNSYSEFVASKVKDGSKIIQELTPSDADALHMAVGVAGEAGELLDAIKRGAIYKKKYDVDNIEEELGDLEFFMERIRQIFGLTRENIIKRNIAKLSARYEKGYSNQAAHERADKA